jgi:hypothetical protein
MVKKFSERQQSTQLVLFLVSKVGMRKAVKIVTLVAGWGMVARKLKREPTWPEYCAYWNESRATYWRDIKLFREVWPDDKSPQRVWEWCEKLVPARASKDETAAGLMVVSWRAA